MKVKYPAEASDTVDKNAFLYRLYEVLRLEHNELGADLKAGKISPEEWNDYLFTFNEKHDAIVAEILKTREIMKKNSSWLIDLETQFI